MVNIPRIHCHSAFKHYEMFHCNNSSGYGNSIFNTTYNFNGGNICGGGFWGGLLGGLGMGLGAGIMNFLGGGFNMFSGGFNMFGGGFPMMGSFGGGMFGGFPMMNMWGGAARTAGSDGAGGTDKSKKKDNDSSAECSDADRRAIADFNKKVFQLEADLDAKKSGSVDALKKLYEDVLAAQKASKDDEHHAETDAKEYDTLLARLKKLADKNNLVDKDGELVEKTPAVQAALTRGADSVDDEEEGNTGLAQSPGTTTGVQSPTDGTARTNQTVNNPTDTNPTSDVTSKGQTTTNPAEADSAANNPATADADNVELAVGSGKILLKNITTIDNIKGLTAQQAQQIGKENAIKILAKFGITANSEIKQCAGIEEVLLLLEVSQMSVKVAYNEGDRTVSDHWIKGQITNVEKYKDGKLTYKVNCRDKADSTQGNIYTVAQQSNTKFRFSIKESEDFGTGVSLADDNKPYVDYEFVDGHDSLYRKGKRFTTKIPH